MSEHLASGRVANRRVVLLGPQRLVPNLGETIASLGMTGPIATVTAGWQEREPEDVELDAHLGGRTVNLRLYERAGRVFARDPEFAAAHRRRQERLRVLQDAYRVPLTHAMDCVLALLHRRADADVLEVEVDAAVEAVRAIDARHLDRVREVRNEFEAKWRPGEREAIAVEREELAAQLGPTELVAIAGGHVAILLNRLLLFDVAGLAGGRPMVAWSAGAMAIAPRVVLFHDHPAHGSSHPEVLEAGLGLAPDIVPLPQARRRLDLEDRERVALWGRRFAAARPVPLDEGARLEWDGTTWAAPARIVRLASDGSLTSLVAA